MPFTWKVFLTAFSINFIALMIIPTVELVSSEHYNVLFFVLCLFLAVAVSASFVLLILRPIQKNIVHIQSFVEGIKRADYQRRINIPADSLCSVLMMPINELTMHFEEHIKMLTTQNTQLSTILNTMEEGVLVLTPSGSIQHYNKALQNMFPNVENCLKLQVVEAIPVPGLQNAIDAVLTLPPNENGNGQQHLKKNAGPIHLELSPGRLFSVHITRAEGTNDAHLGAVVVFHDISPIVRLERVRRDFVANVSHELRTPLTSIQGYAETLANSEDIPEEYKYFIEVIRKNGAYLARMVEELLALARLENSHIPVKINGVHPFESVQAALVLCRQQLDLRNVQVRVDIMPELMVTANARHLTQVFRNLIENAGRYAPEDGEILVQAKKYDANMTLFAICDQGKGIPKADQMRIFERFYRVEKHRSQGSTGLGLAICKHTVERFGGQIWVESPCLKYATVFYFTLPTFFGEKCD